MSTNNCSEVLYGKMRWESEDILLLKELNPLTEIFCSIYFDKTLLKTYPDDFLLTFHRHIEKVALTTEVDLEMLCKIYQIVSADAKFSSEVFEKITLKSSQGETVYQVYRLGWLIFSSKFRDKFLKNSPIVFSESKVHPSIFLDLNREIISKIVNSSRCFNVKQSDLMIFYDSCEYLKMDFKGQFTHELIGYVRSLTSSEEDTAMTRYLFNEFHRRDPSLALKIAEAVGFSLKFENLFQEDIDLLTINSNCKSLSAKWIETLLAHYPLLRLDLSNLLDYSEGTLEMLHEAVRLSCFPKNYYINICFKECCSLKDKKNFIRLLMPFVENIQFFSWSEKGNDFTDLDQEKLVQALRSATKLKTLNLVKKSKEISQDLIDCILAKRTLESVRLDYSVKDKKVLALLDHPSIKQLWLNLNFDEGFLKLPCRIPYLFVRKINAKNLLPTFFINNSKLVFLSFKEGLGLEPVYTSHFSIKKLKENTFETEDGQRYLLERKTKKRKNTSDEAFLKRKKSNNGFMKNPPAP